MAQKNEPVIPLQILTHHHVGDSVMIESETIDALPFILASEDIEVDQMRTSNWDAEWVYDEAVNRGDIVRPGDHSKVEVDMVHALAGISDEQIADLRARSDSWTTGDGVHPIGGYTEIEDSLDSTIYGIRIDGELRPHRLDGPAVINLGQGIANWYREGRRHRFDGPAIQSANNMNPRWWVFGAPLPEITGPEQKPLSIVIDGHAINFEGPADIGELLISERAAMDNRARLRLLAEKRATEVRDHPVGALAITAPIAVHLEVWVGDEAQREQTIEFDLMPIIASAKLKQIRRARESVAESDWIFEEAVRLGLASPHSGPFTVDSPSALADITDDQIANYREALANWKSGDGVHPTGGYTHVVDTPFQTLFGRAFPGTETFQLHRTDGPARLTIGTNQMEWFSHDRPHRLDGPARVQLGVSHTWIVDGIELPDLGELSQSALQISFGDHVVRDARPSGDRDVLRSELEARQRRVDAN